MLISKKKVFRAREVRQKSEQTTNGLASLRKERKEAREIKELTAETTWGEGSLFDEPDTVAGAQGGGPVEGKGLEITFGDPGGPKNKRSHEACVNCALDRQADGSTRESCKSYCDNQRKVKTLVDYWDCDGLQDQLSFLSICGALNYEEARNPVEESPQGENKQTEIDLYKDILRRSENKENQKRVSSFGKQFNWVFEEKSEKFGMERDEERRLLRRCPADAPLPPPPTMPASVPLEFVADLCVRICDRIISQYLRPTPSLGQAQMIAQEVLTEMRGVSVAGRSSTFSDHRMATAPVPAEATPATNPNENETLDNGSPGEANPNQANKSFIGAVGTANVSSDGPRRKSKNSNACFRQLRRTPGTRQFEQQQERTRQRIAKGITAARWEDCVPALHARGDLSEVRGVTPRQVECQKPAAVSPPDEEMESDWSASAAGDGPRRHRVEPAPFQGTGPQEDSDPLMPVNVFQVAVNQSREEHRPVRQKRTGR